MSRDLVHSSGSPGVSSKPLGSQPSTPYVQCVCVCVYTHTYANVYVMSQHLFNVHTCTCMVVKTPVWMHAYSPHKMHMHPCMRAYITVPKLPFHGNVANLSWVLCEHRAGCRLPSALFDEISGPTMFTQKIPFKSMLAHDAVAAAVLHKHHSIIRVGAGLIQFGHGLHSKCGHGARPIKNSIFAMFCAGVFSLR